MTSALAAGASCQRDRDPRPWLVCYRIYEQCREPTAEHVPGLSQKQCEAYVASKPPSTVDSMIDCVREHPCPGLARRCVGSITETLDLASAATAKIRRGGFGGEVVADDRRGITLNGQRACLTLGLLPRRSLLTLEAGTNAEGTLGITLNGHPLLAGPLRRGWQPLRAHLPVEHIRPGGNDLCLDPAFTPGPAPRLIGGTGVTAPVNLAVRSAGYADGNRAEILVDGKDRSVNRRGLNLAALAPERGAVLSAASFDLFAATDAGERLLRWVTALPDGAIVLVAARDEASRLFDQHALQALRAIGATHDLRRRYRQGYAAVGVKGAAPGSALEQLRRGEPAVVALGAWPARWPRSVHLGRLTIR